MLTNLNELSRTNILRLVLPRLDRNEPEEKIVWTKTYEHPFFMRYYIPYHQDDSGSFSSIQVTCSMADFFDLSNEELELAAFSNVKRICQITNLRELIYEVSGETLPKLPYNFVVVNYSRDYLFGAAAAVSKTVIDNLHRMFGETYILIPSSVHECICAPLVDDVDPHDFTEMVRSVNREEVAPIERLSDYAYFVTNYELEEIM